MKNENLQNWALIAEIIGGIAVVLSLIFVGVEIRQSSTESKLNTKAIAVNAYQELSRQISAVNFESMTNSEFSELIRRVHANEIPTTTPIDSQVSAYLAYTRRHSDMAYFQYRQELINEEQLQSMLGPIIGQLRTDIGKLGWRRSNSYTADFVDYIESYMAQVEPTDQYWLSGGDAR